MQNEATVGCKFGAHHCSARTLLKFDHKLCINTNYSLKKLNRYSFPIFFLKIKKKTLFFYFSVVSGQNFLKTKFVFLIRESWLTG